MPSIEESHTPSIISSLQPSIAKSDFPSTSPKPSVFVCEDNPSFIFLNDLDISKRCGWLSYNEARQDRYCNRVIDGVTVSSACKLSCLTCCADSTSFEFLNDLGITKKCGWLADNATRQGKYCDRVENGILINDACADSCNQCTEVVPSLAPTRIVTVEIPTPSPTPSSCTQTLPLSNDGRRRTLSHHSHLPKTSRYLSKGSKGSVKCKGKGGSQIISSL